MSALADTGRVLRAFAYLRATSILNATRQRLRRLRQPKYALGALVMAGYLWMFFFRQFWHAPRHAGALTPELVTLFNGAAAVALLVVVLVGWLLPGNRAALAFSEAEVAFLFPAPLSRVSLINFSLLRTQLAIFVSGFLLSLLFGRGRGLPGNALQHATGFWLVLATLRLHFLGASFTHERLFGLGLQPWLRRVLGGALLLALASALGWWLATHARPPVAADFENAHALSAWVMTIIDAPPASWLLAPFRWLTAPIFTGGSAAWWLSLLPALALMALNYLWVLRSHVAFEEASIDHARRRAERSAAHRSGRSGLRTASTTARPPPFALAPQGFAPTAFLWKGLIAAGPAGRPRNALLLLMLLGAAVFAIAQTAWRPGLAAVGGGIIAMSAWVLAFGPAFAQRSLRDTLDQLDIYKTAPVTGWQVALGQLLTPVVLLSAAQWLMMLVGLMSALATAHSPFGLGERGWALLGGVMLLSPPLAMLLMCVPFAGLLWFPAWASAFSSRGGGFEVAGQRMIFVFVFFLVMALALLPAALVGGLLYWVAALLDAPATGIALGAVVAAAMVAAEAALCVRQLGRRIDHFDLSQEMA